MTNHGHRLTGLGAAAIAWSVLNLTSGIPLFGAMAAIAGANAPDWLEMPYGDYLGRRKSVIPHRTITHWLPVWLALAVTCAVAAPSMTTSLGLGFAIGGLMHLLMDIPNPMGIPILTPFRRKSLRLWPSGTHEIRLVAATWLVGLLAVLLTEHA